MSSHFSKALKAGFNALFALTFCFQAQAETQYNFAGFASFAYAKAINDDDNCYPSAGCGLNYAEITEDGEYRDFNRLGLRLDMDLGNNLSFATQAVMRGSEDYEPDFDWIYLSYKITNELSLSVGKTTIPLYMYSDYLDATYAYQWIEAPFAVYGRSTVKSTEGLRLSWRKSLGGLWSSYLTIWGGDTTEKIKDASIDTDLTVDGGYGIAWEVERDWLTLRAVYYTGDTQFSDAANALLIGAANQVIDTSLSPSLNQDFAWDGDTSQFYGIGIGIDLDSVFFSSEATHIKVDGNNLAANENNSWYAMAGTRLPASWTLSLTVSGDIDKANDDIAKEAAATGNYVGPQIVGLQSLVEAFQKYESMNYTLGSRWDFHPQASLKIEYLMSHVEQGNLAKRKPQGFRVGVDLIF